MVDNAYIAGAMLAFLASVVGLRLVGRPAPPGGRASPVAESGPSAGPSGAESRASRASPGHRLGRTRALVEDRGQAAGGSDDPIFRMSMNSHAHAVEFVMWMRGHGFTGRYSTAEIVEFYGDWFVYDLRVHPLDVQTFLTALGRLHSSVRKKRDRVKCPRTGKVLRLASGTPVRAYYYTIKDVDEVKVPRGAGSPSRAAARPARARASGPNDILAGYETGVRDAA